MTYKGLGLKCGIEIHQQLDGKKLFCDCSTIITEDNSSEFSINRNIRAVAGEGGKIDIAAKQEQLRKKDFIYHGKDQTACLVDTDSEPPHPINQNAVYASLQFAKIVNSKITSVVQVMRKTVADGSNTSGFQRTALVARGGKITTSEGDVGIENISIEEDSCRIINESINEKTYHLDRLGIPLIEVGTAPDIKSPQQCQEAAKQLGYYLRSLPNCKRGLGTIRQDVNVSIREGARVEIKGAQDLKMIPTLVELEVKRQHELIKIKKELKTKKIKLEKLKITDLTKIFSKSDSKIIVNTFKNKGKILGLKLVGFAGMVGKELQPKYRLGTEFAGRAKIKAGVGGIFHSDELPAYGLTENDVKNVKKVLGCKKNDAFILVADKEHRAKIALEAVHERASELFKGIPKEVRKAQQDGTTRFMRPMPSAARMYPETDVPLIVTKDLGKIILPELLEDKFLRFQKDYGLSKDLAGYIGKSSNSELFEELTTKYSKIKPAFIAETLGPTLLELRRKYNVDSDKLTDENFRNFFKYLSQDKIHKDITIDVLIDMIKNKFDLKNYESLSTEDLHHAISKVISKNKNVPMGALMGICMKQLAGKASGKVISTIIKEIMSKGHK